MYANPNPPGDCHHPNLCDGMHSRLDAFEPKDTMLSCKFLRLLTGTGPFTLDSRYEPRRPSLLSAGYMFGSGAGIR